MRPTRTVLIRRGLSGARLACACALQTSRGQAQATAVFPSHTANVAEGSAAGYELEVVLSPRIAICPTLDKFVPEPKTAMFVCVNGGVNWVETISPSKREQFRMSSLRSQSDLQRSYTLDRR